MNKNCPQNNIEKDEVIFWENKFTKQLRQLGNLPVSISDDRLYPREKFLISKIRPFVNTKSKVLEIGGGNFKTAKVLLDPDKYSYFYVGSDISLSVVRIGQQIIKTGEFLQCDVNALPFLPECFDIIFSFGVLHHTSSLEDNIPQLFKLLRDGGLLVLHEPVNTKYSRNSKVITFFKNFILKEKEIAPMQNKLNESKLFHHLYSESQIVSIKREYSPVRLILIKLFRKLIPNNLALRKFILLLDDVTIQLSKLLEVPLLKYSGIMILAKKQKIK